MREGLERKSENDWLADSMVFVLLNISYQRWSMRSDEAFREFSCPKKIIVIHSFQLKSEEDTLNQSRMSNIKLLKVSENVYILSTVTINNFPIQI